MIPLFDAHCDTLFELERRGLPRGSLSEGCLHTDLRRLGSYSPAAQFFAIWGTERHMPDCNIFDRLYARFIVEMESGEELVSFCTGAEAAEKAAEEGRIAAFLSVEGAQLLNYCERLEEAYEKGVRMLTLTWNDANAVSGTCFEDSTSGLTDTGRSVVRNCQRMGVIVDLSHISRRGFSDVLDIAEKPVIASHSCADAVNRNARNLTDDQLRLLRDCGGVAGLNLYTQFLGGDGMDDCLRHIEHILDVGGEKTLALGGDLDGCSELPRGFRGVESWKLVYNELTDRGYPVSLLEDIFCNNLMRVVRNICDM